MANRIPLIVDTTDSNKIKELASGDNLNLSGNNIVGLVSLTASGNVIAGSVDASAISIGGNALSTVARTGAYSDITGTPTNVSAFTNDSNYIANGANISLLTNDAGYLSTVTFADITSTPTTLAGYGITDAATSAQGARADAALVAGENISRLNNDAGYITLTQVQSGSLTIDVNNSGDLIGSVFAQDSTIMIDGILGAVNLDNTIRGHVTPFQADTWDIGSSDNKFNDGYFAGTVTGQAFVGDGSGLTGISASGTLQTAGNIGTGSVDLSSETLTVTGTTNQVDVEASAFALSISLSPTIERDLKGSVFGDDSTLLVDGVNSIFTGNLTGDVTGSVFADDSTQIIDSHSQTLYGTLVATAGTAPALSGDPGAVGEIRFDDNYIYIKTSGAGWKRAALSGLV